MHGCSLLRLIAICCVSIALVSTSGGAQDEYTLTDEDTWAAEPAEELSPSARELHQARLALAQGEHERAESLASRWLKRHKRDPLIPEAHLIRGDALLVRHEHYEALFDFEAVARLYPGSEAFVTALEREMHIATLFLTGTKRKIWGLRILSAVEDAEEVLIRIQERLPGSRLAEQAGLMLADYYFDERRIKLAGDAYLLFLELYPNSPEQSKARRRLIYCYLASFKGPQWQATGLYDARARLHELRAREPAVAQQVGADGLLLRIDEADAQRMLATARWYLRIDDPIATERTIRKLIERYPRTVAAREALMQIDEILEQLPENVRNETPDYVTLREAIMANERDEKPELAQPLARAAERDE
jgi:outer membrane protein assembly factor BamD (BamD/ComL family)